MSTPLTEPLRVPDTADALLVLERIDEAFYAIDREWRLLYVNRRAEEFWGRSRDEILGRSMLEVFAQFAGSPSHAAHREAMETQTFTTVEVISTATNRPVELRLFPNPDGLSAYFHDITERRELQQELRARDELLTLAEESAGIGIWVADLDTQTVVATPQFYHLLGIPPVAGPVPQELPRRYRHPEDRDRVISSFTDALARGFDSHDSEYRVIRPSGEVRWIFGRGKVIRDASGRPWRYTGVDIDITEKKKQEEHLQTVMGELLHRTNNLLAVVQGFARQTARGSRSLAEFIPKFGARLQGLGESSVLLARQDWRGADLDALIRAQATPFADASRLTLTGPPILLSPRAVQNVGLALHELFTNATKYGALSLPAGHVEVEWSLAGAGEQRRLVLRWRELGGPTVTRPRRAGFGRVVAEQMIANALDARVTTSFAPEGVTWTLELPGAEFTAE
jgi:PAS domain S-box-containing protein